MSIKVKFVSQRLPRFLSLVLAMSARAKSHAIKVQDASRSIYESRPKEVAALIEEAARHAQDR
jgi:hypothetical protein